MHVDTESGAQWGSKQTAPSGSTHQSERSQVYLNAACTGSLVYHNVYTVVLHGTVQVFLHDRAQTVYLINKENVVGFQASKDTCQIAWLIQNGTTGELKSYTQFVGNDITECGLSQSWRTMQQGMIQGFPTELGGLNKDAQVLYHLQLTAEILEPQGSKGILKVLLLVASLLSYIKFFHNSKALSSSASIMVRSPGPLSSIPQR